MRCIIVDRFLIPRKKVNARSRRRRDVKCFEKKINKIHAHNIYNTLSTIICTNWQLQYSCVPMLRLCAQGEGNDRPRRYTRCN